MLFFFLSLLETPEEKQKFTELYEANRGKMFSVARGILHDDYLAEDAVDQAFLRLIRYNFRRVEGLPCNQARSYLVRIVKNTAIDMYNKQRKIVEVAFDESYEADDRYENESLSVQLEYGEILAAVERLPEIYREVLFLSYSLGFSVSETAHSLNISASAVKLRMMRGRLKLRAMLEGTEET